MLPRSGKLKLLAEYLGVSEAFLMGWTVSDEKIGDTFGNSMKNNTEAQKPTTIAAHFDGDEYTAEELDQIRKFAEFVKSQRKDSDTLEVNAAHHSRGVFTDDERQEDEDMLD